MTSDFTSCPGCGTPAEITGRFVLPSTDGPIAHVAVSCVRGHHYRLAADALPPGRPAPGWPRTFQLCIHCLAKPAGFWVSRKDSRVVRRPWCLSCCEDLDRARCDVTPFGG